MKIQPNSRLIMIGDSVTDHGRAQPAGEGLFEAIGRGWGGIGPESHSGSIIPEQKPSPQKRNKT